MAIATGGWVAAVVVVAVAGAIAAAVWAVRRSPTSPLVRRSLLDHIEELRRRVLIVVATLLAGVLVALSVRVAQWHGYWVPVPDAYDNVSAQVLRLAARFLVPKGVQLAVTGPTDAFMAEFHVALGLAVALALPVALVQVGRFVLPALKARERRLLALLLVPALTLFVLGAVFCFAVILPSAFSALYTYADVLGAQSLLQVNTFVTFTVLMCLTTGAGFETPLLMYGLGRLGLVQARTFARLWRQAIVGIVVFAAWITPDPTFVSQVLVAVPLIGLYALGTGLAYIGQRAHARAA